MQLSIIIVNYRSHQLITDCIRSVIAETQDLSYEIIVVDNHSQDESREVILQAFPQVRWVQMDYNAGFARGNNAGLRIAQGEYLLLLNPDTIVLERALDRCVQRFSEAGDAAACGIQLLNVDGSPQITGAYFMKGGLNHLLPLPYWGKLLRSVAFAMNTKAPSVEAAGAAQEVDWINGAFLMVKKATVQQAGLMDEDFFLYAEETEWCSRILRTGKLVVYGDLHVIHLQGATANVTFAAAGQGYYDLYSRKGLQLMVSNHLRVRKQYGVLWFLILLLNYTFAVPVFFVCSFFDNLFHGRNPFKYWGQAAKFTGNVLRLWGLTPTIIRNQPHFYKVL